MRHVYWGVKVRSSLHGRGFATMQQFLRARPAVPWRELGQELDVAPLCVQLYAQYEARALGAVEFVLRDDLVRQLATALPHGWGDEWARRLSAWNAWDIDVTPDTPDRCDAAWRRLDRGLAFARWRPTKADDPVLLRAFERTR